MVQDQKGRTEPKKALTPGGGAAAFVWGIWALLVVMGVDFTWKNGCRFPYVNEWDLVPILTGEAAVKSSWLWAPHAGHRMPLAKLLWARVLKLTGNNFRVGPLLNLGLMAGLAAVLIVTAKRSRGRRSYADAFFPLLLLHLGHWEAFWSWWQITEILPWFFLLLFVAIMAGSPTPIPLGSVLAGGSCLLALALSGPVHWSLVVGPAVWLGLEGAFRRGSRASPAGRTRLVAVGVAGVVALVALGMSVGSPPPAPAGPPPAFPPPPPWQGGLQVLSIGLGPGLNSFWLYGGIGVLGVMGVGIAFLVLTCWKQPPDRWRALGLLLLLGVSTGVAVDLGSSREVLGPDAGLVSRYGFLAAPMLCIAFLGAGIYRRNTLGLLVQVALFDLVLILLPVNLRAGLNESNPRAERMKAFEQDVAAGVPVLLLAEQYGKFLYTFPDYDREPLHTEEIIAADLRRLRDARVGLFRLLPSLPAQKVSFPLEPAAVNQMTWANGVGTGSGTDQYLIFALDRPRFVQAIQFIYFLETEGAKATIQLSWRQIGRNDFAEEERCASREQPVKTEQTLIVAVHDTIDQVRVKPGDKPGVLKVTELVAAAAAAAAPRPTDPVDGALDVANPAYLAGWAWDPKQPTGVVAVDLFDGDTLLGTVPADQFRSDLWEGGKGSGCHAFTFPVPAKLRDGEVHSLRVRVAGTAVELHGSPQEVTWKAP